MRNSILITLMLIAISTWAQKVSSTNAMDDILLKLNKLEELKGANDTVSSLKVITDTMYAQSVEPKQASVEDSNVLKAQIIFDTATYDMGSITQGEIAKQRFEFVNNRYTRFVYYRRSSRLQLY